MTTTEHPHRGGGRWVTDGGLETDLIFNRAVDLPEFAAFPLLEDEAGRALLRDYFDDYARIAADHAAGLLLETPTWRANPDWGARVGYAESGLATVNAASVDFLRGLAASYSGEVERMLVSGTIGPRGDGYAAGSGTDPEAAREYHRGQVEAFADAGADLVTAYTLTDPGEAVGIVVAAREASLPVAISFTLETDGRLPGGLPLAEAIGIVDAAGGPDYYLVNCAHPVHVLGGLPDQSGDARQRVIGIRANASTRSHAELDASDDLDAGDLAEFVDAHRRLVSAVGDFTIVGGCCGTDASHVAAIWDVDPQETAA